uniref:Glycosyltransferase 36 n=1 Tax=Rhodopseudomonas palustris (strain BisA53) TaxID=316055 RepID=Q07KF2_RHOP5
MNRILRSIFRNDSSPLWEDKAPVREELFGIERLEQHAESLAGAQSVTASPPKVLPLRDRLDDNAAVLLDAYRASAKELESGRSVVPAAEWLLDNYHVVEQQVREIRDDLPPGYYRQLPKLAKGPFAGYPRVFGVTWAFVAHTDSHFDPDTLRRFILAYQRVEPLTIGELWAVAITLRIVLIENLRRLADQITGGREVRGDAAALAARHGSSQRGRAAFEAEIAARASGPLSERFAAELAKQLRDQDPSTTPAYGWLEEQLTLQQTSIDEVVQRVQQRQGASNVTARNIVNSMRLISGIDWSELFESVSLVDQRLCADSDFAKMDFPTRNLYRSAIEQMARCSPCSEIEIANRVLDVSSRARSAATTTLEAERVGDPGYHLIAEGRREFEKAIDFRQPGRVWLGRVGISLGIRGYVGATVLVATLLLLTALWALAIPEFGLWTLALIALVGFVPVTEVASALINRMITWSFGAVALPGLELADGVPRSLRTMIAVPTLLTSEAALLEQIEGLEVHHLAGTSGDLVFALLSDGVDADQEVVEGDARLLEIAVEGIDRLNQRYGPGPAGDRFLWLHRRRLFNPAEGKWMGWERKRGKICELNRLLRGATDTSFVTIGNHPPHVPPDVRFVIVLDADTRLPRDAAARLIGKMAHPLNRPIFDEAQRRVVRGYGILQPRVTPSLPVGREGSLYQRVFSSPGGMDPYASAVSDVYQDLFGEGSFTGKGIYDVDAFAAALSGRVPDNVMLSHDLFEGVFARAGLASDVEVVDEFPARYDVSSKRQHRWTRGDWQLLPWILGYRTDRQAVPLIGRLKMLDNLRRSLVAPVTLLALCSSWLLPMPLALVASLLVLSTIAIPAFLPLVFLLVPHRSGVSLRSHLQTFVAELKLAALQSGLSIVFLTDHAWQMSDALVRALVRLHVTHRNLLEWTTAAQSSGMPRLSVRGFYRQMVGGTVLAAVLAAAAIAMAPQSWVVAVAFGLLWLSAPIFALWVSRAPSLAARSVLSTTDEDDLRLIARRTWRFFETFVVPSENMLPPDNFQEDPAPVVAHRTSPTNMGLYLLSAVVARDFGWAGTSETVDRLETGLRAMQRLATFKGHFFNWYGTEDMRPLEPVYISSVDSGNLAGHLIALANACEEWMVAPRVADPKRGIDDNLLMAMAAADVLASTSGEAGRQLHAILTQIDAHLKEAHPSETLYPTLKRLTEKALKVAQRILVVGASDSIADIAFWVGALNRSVVEHDRDHLCVGDGAIALNERLQELANTARKMALAMDFAFLIDPERKLLSIGYAVAENRQDQSCYDLLASEARLASLFAIAKGDVETKHWFRLGRSATPLGNGSALISWSGSMFEYLMPSLVMRAPEGSLLEQTTRLVVQRQQSYATSLGIPWGISESAYNARDTEFTYQYSNFGVPGLGLKRGLSENLVIAPYATGLATMVAPLDARDNYRRLADIGALGRYGFYEALDFTPTRLPANRDVAIVRNFMAHHQGMTIVAIANTLQNGLMRARFHREPMIQACELLLQERMPRDIAMAHPRAEEVKASGTDVIKAPSVRRLIGTESGPPAAHLLSNGRYSVMLTKGGGGYSRWHDLAITRWREDVTRDQWGSLVLLREVQSGQVWSACGQAVLGSDQKQEVIFGEDHAEFSNRDGTLTTTLDVLVSCEDDGEVRRVSLTNNRRRPRDIELTSFSELALAPAAADAAHPAFSKMFVQTEYLPEFRALIATRRRRSPNEPEVWAAHFAVVEGDMISDVQYETDRARFIGRGASVESAASMADGVDLSNTVGTVLDPIFSLRLRVRIPPRKIARVAFWTVVADSREKLLDIVDKLLERNAFDRAKTWAWTQAQVQLRHLDVETQEAMEFQRLVGPILYADPRFRVSSTAIIRGGGAQSGLWPYGISGDFPIVLVRIDDIDDIAQVRQALRAHEYWLIKGLGVDLVIINERAASYFQDLQIAIETAVRVSQSRPPLVDDLPKGSVYVLRAALMTGEGRDLLLATARVVLTARRGSIADHLAQVADSPRQPRLISQAPAEREHQRTSMPPVLEFFNGLGGFANEGKEYVTYLNAGQVTPAPWINVIANPGFGFQASVEGSGYTWAENSRENQLTPWSNDPVVDPTGEAIYVRDAISGQLWTATAQPIRDNGTYIASHGFGYSRFEHQANGIGLKLLQYVPLADPIKISRLTLTNLSNRSRRLSVTAFAEWVLGTSRGASAPFIATEIDAATGAMFARNSWSIPFGSRVAFADLGGQQSSWTADRTEFLGRRGKLSAPGALATETVLSKSTGAGLDPCAALQTTVVLAANESIEVTFLLGQCQSSDDARALIMRYREADLDAVLSEVVEHWDGLLGAVQVKTPDRAMDIMLNGWLLYQTLACRVWARSAFYQASGAYGFRDQLQDGMALSFAKPDETRRHLLRAAARQFVEGDVQHWWLPYSGQGVRTRISDDRVWLAYATATYVASSGDVTVLDELVPFLEGPDLDAGQHDAFFVPATTDEKASLFEHCARGLDQCLALTGELGLPLMGTGDWNDGMNRVGEGGKGESVWLGWLLLKTIEMFSTLAQARDGDRADRWRAHASALRLSIEQEAWDGDWYRRATFDDGTWLGSKDSSECTIDSIAQSWAVLSDAAMPERAVAAMTSLTKQLIRRDDGMALLFTPPFDNTPLDPGYIKGYPPGLRENGGQYSHAAMWAILALTKLGQGEQAVDLFSLLNPINHGRTPEEIERYKVEPYVVAADVYSVAPHVGRGGWTWYTGAAGWMYRAGIEGILGIRREGEYLLIDPCIPEAWPGFEISIVIASTRYRIEVTNCASAGSGLRVVVLNGLAIACPPGPLRVSLDRGDHSLEVRFQSELAEAEA